MQKIPTRKQIIKDIRTFINKEGISESAFGLTAINDHKLIGEIEKGRNLTLETCEKIYSVINNEQHTS